MAERRWPRDGGYRFIWWGFDRKQWMLRRFHAHVGFYRFDGWEGGIWRWVVWIGPLNFYRAGIRRTEVNERVDG